ncbi:MAG: TonB C-terminal domain-containing protein [Steroidobacter sp.]
MRNNNPQQVEVIIVDDPWAAYGKPLPGEGPPPARSARSIYEVQRSRWPVWSAAALFTTLVHSLLIGSLLLGTPARKYQRPMNDGGDASAQDATAGEFVSTLIFIDDHAVSSSQEQDDSAYRIKRPASKQKTSRQQDIAIISDAPQVEIAGSENGTSTDSTSMEAVGDTNGRAMLFGRYMGQIKARIERAWNYPVNSSLTSFSCTVQIKQSRQGEVIEVTMTHCDTDAAWQLSLANAIQAASPLSAPPDETVFTELVTLNFDASNLPAIHSAIAHQSMLN